MSENRFWNLLAKKLSGEASAQDLSELEELLKTYPELVFSAEQIESLWKLENPEIDHFEAELAFDQLIHKKLKTEDPIPDPANRDGIPYYQGKTKWGSGKKLIRISVLSLCVLLICILFWQYPFRILPQHTNKDGYSEISTLPGSRSTKLVLPDSSIVWLNAGSSLSYSEHFGKENRNATLSGEAFFEVKKSSIPFIIKTNNVTIRVLGTAFNVRSYPNETTETSLIRGKLEIKMNNRPGETIILKPEEKLVVADRIDSLEIEAERKGEPFVILKEIAKTPDSMIIETSWMENRLIFQDQSFGEIAGMMERWYGVSIEISDVEIRKLRLTGSFEKETIEEALNALKIAYPFSFTIHRNKIKITK